MKNTTISNPPNQAQVHTRRSPFLLSTAVALGAAMLLASPSPAESEKTTLTPDDENFVQKAAASGMTMVKISTIAVEKAERGDVKAFAGTLVSDHTKANEDLTKLALAKGVALNTDITPEQDKTIGSLNHLSGAEFDKMFISTVQSGHQKCAENFEWAAADAKDTEVKTWATSMLPTLKLHQTKADELGSPTNKGESPNAKPDADFSSNDISALFADKESGHDFAHEKNTKAPEGAVTGAGTGGVLGGAAIGATVGGLAGGLIGMAIPELEAKRYEDKLKEGNILISVHTESSDEITRAKAIFEQAGAEDICTASNSATPEPSDDTTRGAGYGTETTTRHDAVGRH